MSIFIRFSGESAARHSGTHFSQYSPQLSASSSAPPVRRLWLDGQHGGEFSDRRAVRGDEFFEAALRPGAARGVKGAADVGGALCAHFQTRDVGLAVLVEMKLAALRGGWMGRQTWNF